MMIHMRENEIRREGPPAAEGHLTCEEFQAQMPELIGSETIHDHEHLKTCERCSALLEELEYIASIAGELMPAVYDPPDALWGKIESSLPWRGDNDSPAGNGHSPIPIGKK